MARHAPNPHPTLNALAALAPTLSLIAGRWRVVGDMADCLLGLREAPAQIVIDLPEEALDALLEKNAFTVMHPLALHRTELRCFRGATLLVKDCPVVLRVAETLRERAKPRARWKQLAPLTEFVTVKSGKHHFPVLGIAA